MGVDLLAPKEMTTGRKSVRYKLFVAVYHHGVSAVGGHYTLDVSHAAARVAYGIPSICESVSFPSRTTSLSDNAQKCNVLPREESHD
ncbi:hypothetical protein DFH09DRAFT_1323333 [Mycena vulgaris]|nr:hypothetical protein DFH09DRAFT_1323333 [Mycena vulgaris]